MYHPHYPDRRPWAEHVTTPAAETGPAVFTVADRTVGLGEGFKHVRTEAPGHRLSGWLGQRSASVVRHPGALLTAPDLPETK